MRQSTSLDWFRVTMEYGKEDIRDYLPTTKGGELIDCPPMRPYSSAKGNRYISVHWSDRNPEWRVMVQMTGSQLSLFRKEGGSIRYLFSWAVAMGARFTRIDYAVDLFDSGGNPLDLKECFHTSQLDTIAKSVAVVEKTHRSKTLGATVYIGSRSSERLIRVYDKGKKSKTKLDWIRVEIEVKGKRAVQFGNLIDKIGLDVAGKGYLADVTCWSDVDWYEQIWGDGHEVVDIDAIGRPETDRERWLRTVVLPVIHEELESGSDWLRNALEAALLSTGSSDGHGPLLPRAKVD